MYNFIWLSLNIPQWRHQWLVAGVRQFACWKSPSCDYPGFEAVCDKQFCRNWQRLSRTFFHSHFPVFSCQDVRCRYRPVNYCWFRAPLNVCGLHQHACGRYFSHGDTSARVAAPTCQISHAHSTCCL